MSGGAFAVARGVFDHPFFAKQPFTEREAWLWLIAEASWKPRRVKNGPIAVDLDRGQCCHSLRYMAEVWQWSKTKVQRFLDRLKKAEMIGTATGTPRGTASGTGITVITICNYSEYQPQVGADRDSNRDTTRDSNRSKANKDNNSDTIVSGAGSSPIDIRQVLFTEGLASLRRQTGKADASARKIIGGWLKSAKDDAALVLTKIRQAEADQVVDAVAWVTAAIKGRSEHSFLWARG